MNKKKSRNAVERRSRRMSLALPPTLVKRMDAYVAKSRRTYMPLSRTDVIVMAVDRFLDREGGPTCN
jgi:hypothetical protein